RPLLTATPSTRTVTQFTCYRFIDAFGQPAPRPTSTSSTKTTSSISTTAAATSRAATVRLLLRSRRGEGAGNFRRAGRRRGGPCAEKRRGAGDAGSRAGGAAARTVAGAGASVPRRAVRRRRPSRRSARPASLVETERGEQSGDSVVARPSVGASRLDRCRDGLSVGSDVERRVGSRRVEPRPATRCELRAHEPTERLRNPRAEGGVPRGLGEREQRIDHLARLPRREGRELEAPPRRRTTLRVELLCPAGLRRRALGPGEPLTPAPGCDQEVGTVEHSRARDQCGDRARGRRIIGTRQFLEGRDERSCPARTPGERPRAGGEL